MMKQAGGPRKGREENEKKRKREIPRAAGSSVEGNPDAFAARA